MASQIKAYPIVENAINLFGDWLKHRHEMRELRDMNSGDFARIARDLCVSPAELDEVVRQGPHASDELPRLLKSLGIDEATCRGRSLSCSVTWCASVPHVSRRPGAIAISTQAPSPSTMSNTAPMRRPSTNWTKGRDAFVSSGR
jgi:hypothetical protein